MISIREFRTGDEAALHSVFRSAVHDIACADYTPEQIEAWAPRAIDYAAWVVRMQGIRPFVAERDGAIVGYADLQPDGYIDHFFVAANAAHTGVGSLLMCRIRETAVLRGIALLTSNVSITARPFFAKFGFDVVEPQTATVRGVTMTNFRMHAVPLAVKCHSHQGEYGQ
jgi:putative acetyltransferase